MDELRMALAAATGAIIGGMVVVALSWTLRAVARPSGAAETERYGETARSRHPPSLHWLAKAAILLASIGAYGYVGYTSRPLASASSSAASTPRTAAAAPAPLAAPAHFMIGGVDLTFAPPAGYCLYPEPLLQTVVAQQSKINPDNVIHEVFADCDELRRATTDHARIRDFGMVMTPKSQLDETIGPAEFDRIVAGSVDPVTLKETMDQRLRDAQSRLRLQSVSTLGMLDRGPGAAYFGYLFRAGNAAGGFTQACVMALTTLKGRLVSYYLYSDYSRDARPTLDMLMHRVKASLGNLAARNS